MVGGVSITDLTLNDFRMDLSEYMKNHLAELQNAPDGLFSVTLIDAALADIDYEPGVIFCLKNVGSKVQTDGSYALAPYYLIYVTDDGRIKYTFTHAKKILDLLKKQGLGASRADTNAVEVFNAETKTAADMHHYQALLETAITNIIGKSDEKGVESLFSRGGTVLTKDTFKGMEDFEVVSYLILKQPL